MMGRGAKGYADDFVGIVDGCPVLVGTGRKLPLITTTRYAEHQIVLWLGVH